MKKAPAAVESQEVTTATESESGASTRAPRDPHGHKLIKIGDVLDAGHKTKYLPLGDGQYTANLYFQPWDMKECGKNWCEMEMLELINGSTTVRSTRTYSIDCEDLLKMCYLHAMANLDVQAAPRLHFEQWVLSIFQDYCASCGSADYTDRGSIARYYLERVMYSFAVGPENANGDESRLEMFFQKRCIRDLSKEADERVKIPKDNVNVVAGKSVKAKFEYQIEGYIMCVPEGAWFKKQRPDEEMKEGESTA